jgi:ABC-type polysaccharide/polyol phosphate export permease
MVSAFCRGFTNYFVDLWSYRYFWLNLVRAELQRRYRRSFLGLGWSMLQPLSMTLALGLVYGKLLGISFWDFAPMLLCGLAFWNMISQSILRGCDSLVTSESYIRQQPLPLAMFPLRMVLTSGFHFLVSFALTLLIVWPLRRMFDWGALMSIVPTLALLFVFCWSMATLAGFAHTYFPDTQHLAEVSLHVLMFLTPIMYPASLLSDKGMGWLVHYNPLAVLVEMLRMPVLRGEVPPLATYALAAVMVSVPAGLATWVVARFEDRVIFTL